MGNLLTCVIVDDEPLAIKLLENFVGRTPFLQLKASYTDSIEALSALHSEPADLVFLDIQMPDLDGLELARAVNGRSFIVFTTAFKEYAFDSYEVQALDYLLKPIRYNKFLAAAEKARERKKLMDYGQEIGKGEPERGTSEAQQKASGAAVAGDLHDASNPNFAFLRIDGELRRIDFARIAYVEGMKDYVMFHLEGEKRPLITHLTMKVAEELLPAGRFMRVHRSFIVALDKIRKVDRNLCIYIGEEIIHVTDAYRESFETFLNQRLPSK
ncbi:MAG: response regulator transcription factor [Prevotella sp.]|nr:response regulator transcription factor [Prevotella sp.]